MFDRFNHFQIIRKCQSYRRHGKLTEVTGEKSSRARGENKRIERRVRGNNDDGLRFGIDKASRKLPQGTLRLGYLFYSPAANFGYQKGRMRGYSHEYNWAEHDVLPGNDDSFSVFVECNKLAEQSAVAFRPSLSFTLIA